MVFLLVTHRLPMTWFLCSRAPLKEGYCTWTHPPSGRPANRVAGRLFLSAVGDRGRAQPGSQLVLIKGAPYGLNVTHADQFNWALLDSLDQLTLPR
jgi:hypothetical protein